MKTLKLITLLTAIFWLSITPFAQTQKFDVMTYTPPKGWTVGQNGQAKTFTTVDKTAGNFCMMFLYPSVTNHGTPSQDFAYVWKTLVQDTFKAGGNPETQSVDSDGFTIISGGELIEFEGNKALAMLTTVSGKGKVVSLLAIFNDAKYSDDIQAFLSAMDIDIKETPKAKPTSQGSGSGFSGSISDYEFTTPPKWTRQDSASEIVLKKKTEYQEYTISMQPFVASSGNLESDAETIFWQVFQGWAPSTENGFRADYGQYAKGKTVQGFDYFQVKKYITKKSGNDNVRMDGTLLLIQIGNKVAVISAGEPYQTAFDAAEQALDHILYDFRIASGGANANLQKDLVGSWSSFGSSVGLSYTYHSNGTFSFAGASQFRTSRDAVYDNVTTTSFSSDGTYKLSGNLMTIVNKKSGITSQDRIRFYSTKYDRDDWEYKMGKIDTKTGGTIVYRKDK
jgi:hypothetical protein